MIRGIGIDVIEVNRIKKLHKEYGDKFLKRIYTEEELSYCMDKVNMYQCLSGRFSAKEAVIKATGGRIKEYKKVAVLNGKQGPYVKISDGDFYNILISITHIKGLALAMAIWEG